jgi:teichuronic acid biosynthesis glycosyltransferase TuaC
MKLLFISNLFPDAQEPRRGIHNARLVRRLAQHCDLRVIAPRPRLIFTGKGPARRPCSEDAEFAHAFPPVRYVPKIGGFINHKLFACDLRKAAEPIIAEFAPDLILCAWLYPDGCAAADLARAHDVPLVLIAQGSDVHQYLGMAGRSEPILAACGQAALTMTRGRNLAETLQAAGIPETQVATVYNGVDLETFRPATPDESPPPRPPGDYHILYVGNLYAIKNPNLLVAAHAKLDNRFALTIVGDGPLRGQDSERVRYVGSQPPEVVAAYLRHADILCVPSNNEGVPNVIREAFASGTPVIATRVGGIPEVLENDSLGRLVPPRDPVAMAKAIAEFADLPVDRAAIRTHAERFSWEATVQTCLQHFERAVQNSPKR